MGSVTGSALEDLLNSLKKQHLLFPLKKNIIILEVITQNHSHFILPNTSYKIPELKAPVFI